MEGKNNKHVALLFIFCLVVLCTGLMQAQHNSYDSLGLRLPKHYFNTVFVFDVYNKSPIELDTTGRKERNKAIDNKLKNYGVKQFNLSFYVPLATHEHTGVGADSNVVVNTHLLLTGNLVILKPVFGGIEQHTLTRRSIGLRYIYNTGKKGVWFFDVSPFTTRDITYGEGRRVRFFRLASTVVYSRNVNDKFNWRVGATKSFLWGNRYYFPFIGIRLGRLDKVNFSLQFPRNISLNIPLGSKLRISIYSSAQGGLFNFSNRDTIYPITGERAFHFARYEVNTGLRFDVRLGGHFAMFVCAGTSTKNNITFYSDRVNPQTRKVFYSTYFYNAKPGPTGFLQMGLVLKFGKTRSYFGNHNIYDAIDLNSQINNNDNNSQIIAPPRKTPYNANLESIQDLMDYNDF